MSGCGNISGSTGIEPENRTDRDRRIRGRQVGFAVDRVIGEHQTVLKNLGRYFRNVETISGATILGDGTVALIVDVSKLVEGVAALEAENQ